MKRTDLTGYWRGTSAESAQRASGYQWHRLQPVIQPDSVSLHTTCLPVADMIFCTIARVRRDMGVALSRAGVYGIF